MDDSISRMVVLCHTQKTTELQRNHLHLIRHINTLKSSAFAFLQDIFDQYSDLVQLQRKYTLMKVEAEKMRLQKQIVHTQVLYELKRFAFHIGIETKSKIRVLQLFKDSPQFQRCEKAVIDNFRTTSSPNSSSKENLQVVGVFKLENSIRTQKFEVRCTD